MTFDLLVRGVDKSIVGAGFDDDHRLTNQKGNVVKMAPSPVGAPVLGAKEVPPAWCVIRADISQAIGLQCLSEWRQALSFEFRSIQPKNDSWQFQIEASRVRKRDLHGGASHPELKIALEDWGATGVAQRGNMTRGNITVLRAARSIRLLGEPLAPAARFTELRYDIGSGLHLIEFNFAPVNAQGARLGPVARTRLQELAVRVKNAFHVRSIDQAAKTALIEVWRNGPPKPRRGRQVRPGDNVRQAIVQDIKRRADMRVGMRRHRIGPTIVDLVQAGTHPGSVSPGYAIFDRATLKAALQDYLDQ